MKPKATPVKNPITTKFIVSESYSGKRSCSAVFSELVSEIIVAKFSSPDFTSGQEVAILKLPTVKS
jgi:hypothetical protein